VDRDVLEKFLDFAVEDFSEARESGNRGNVAI